jgi:hypothetical protein
MGSSPIQRRCLHNWFRSRVSGGQGGKQQRDDKPLRSRELILHIGFVPTSGYRIGLAFALAERPYDQEAITKALASLTCALALPSTAKDAIRSVGVTHNARSARPTSV